MSQPTWEQQAVESDTFKPDDDDTTEIPKWGDVGNFLDQRLGIRKVDAEPKPMRIRYMELPMEHNGDDVYTPFVMVIDRWPETISDARSAEIAERCRAATGARGVLLFESEVEIGDF